MPFSPTDSRRVLDSVFADIQKLLRRREGQSPTEVMAAIEGRMEVARLVLQDTDAKKKKKKNKKRKVIEGEEKTGETPQLS